LEGKSKNTLVFVTNQRRCLRLIDLGAKIAARSDTQLTVFHVSGGNWPKDPEGLQYLFDSTTDRGGIMQVVYSGNPLKEMTRIMAELSPDHVVMGEPAGPSSVVYDLQEQFPDSLFYFTDPEETDALNGEEFQR